MIGLRRQFSVVRDQVIEKLDNQELEDEDLLKLSPRNLVDYDRIFKIDHDKEKKKTSEIEESTLVTPEDDPEDEFNK